jgi:hypothetical protein
MENHCSPRKSLKVAAMALAAEFILDTASSRLTHARIKAGKDSATAQVDAIMMARDAKAYARTVLMMCRHPAHDGYHLEEDEALRLFSEAGDMLDKLPTSMVQTP